MKFEQLQLLHLANEVHTAVPVLLAGLISMPWHIGTLALVGTSPFKTMPLPSLSSGLSPVRTVVLASI